VNAQEDSNSEYVQAVKTACCNSYMRLVKPWLYPDATFYASPSGWSFSRALKVLHGLTKSVIHKRRGIHTEELMKIQQSAEDGTKLRVAFLDQLLMANHNGAGLSDIDIQEEVDTFMFEGHDTTGCAITFILYALSVNPEIQEMAYREVTSVVGDETRHLTNQDLAQMKYLERVIKEGMRLYPSVPVFGRSIKEDLALEMDGKRVVPAGATVAICPYVLHRKESLWPDPERFDPDRFLPENSVGRHAFAYLPFSAGPRNCIGQKFAMLEMKCVIARLLMELRFIEAYPGYKPEVAGELILKSRNEHVLVRVEQRHL
ncbi:Cytochrome P450 CYP4, partial [Frankliniella occidentalis]